MPEKIIEVDALERSKQEYGEFAIYALATRVVADYRDGLKQVHRRTLQALSRLGALPGNRVKSARFVGETLKEHVHGDTSVYDAAKKLVNDFDIYLPLIDGHGGWGTVDGDSQAAMRYTEACISKFSYDNFIEDVRKTPDIVDWVDTFDNRDKEVQYLPSKLPLILINGNYAIGIGMMSVISKHNTNEVIDETIKLIDNPNHRVVLKPDQCMACDIINEDWGAIADSGHGSFVVRGRMVVVPEITKAMVKDNKKYLGLPAVEIISTPDQVNLNSIKKTIIDDMIEKRKLLPQVVEIYTDESKGDDEMGCLIILKKGSDPKYVMDMIYKHTHMQHTVTENYQILYQYNPVVWGQTKILTEWVEWARLRLTRKYYQTLQSLRTQLFIKEAYVKCMDSGEIDTIIKMIRNKKDLNDDASIEWLIKNIKLTTAQSKFILNSLLKNLSEAYRNKYKEDMEKCIQHIRIYENKILNTKILDQDLKKELLDMKAKYGTPRKCKFIDRSEINNIPKGEFKLIITEKNFIKKIPINENVGSLKDDRAVQLLKIDNTQNIIIFDVIGKAYKLPVHKIPIADKSSNGCDVRLIIKNLTSNICTVLPEPVLKDLTKRSIKHFIVIQSKLGNIKRIDIEDILGSTPSGLIYAKLASTDDYINDVVICADGLDIISYSDNKALRYNIAQVPHLKRSTSGNKAMKSDYIDGLVVLNPNMTDIVVLTEKGYMNRFDAVGLLTLQRGKSGSNVIKLGKGDNIKYIFGVEPTNHISIITPDGNTDILVSDIKSQSSISTGQRMVKGNIIQAKVHR